MHVRYAKIEYGIGQGGEGLTASPTNPSQRLRSAPKRSQAAGYIGGASWLDLSELGAFDALATRVRAMCAARFSCRFHSHDGVGLKAVCGGSYCLRRARRRPRFADRASPLEFPSSVGHLTRLISSSSCIWPVRRSIRIGQSLTTRNWKSETRVAGSTNLAWRIWVIIDRVRSMESPPILHILGESRPPTAGEQLD